MTDTVTAPTAVYRLYDAAGKLLYVGISDSLAVRFRDHAAKKYWWTQVVRREVVWHDDRFSAAREEAIAIRTEQPAHNIDTPRVYERVRPEMAASLSEMAARRLSVEAEAIKLEDEGCALIQLAWRVGVPPSEIARLSGRSDSHVRKLRPEDVPPARLGGGAATPKRRRKK